MDNRPNGRGFLAWLFAAHIFCCGALLVFATGALSFASLQAWLFDKSGNLLIAMAVLLIAVLSLWSFRSHRKRRKKLGAPER